MNDRVARGRVRRFELQRQRSQASRACSYNSNLRRQRRAVQDIQGSARLLYMKSNNKTRRGLGRAHVPPTNVFPRLAVNKTILKPRLAAATGGQYVYVGFSRRNKIPRSSAYTISEKAIRFWHSDYNPDRLKSQSVRPCPDICRHATFHPNPCKRF